jgi:hypothetical protein
MSETISPYIAFCDGKRLAAGSLVEVALAVKAALAVDGTRQILIFDGRTSRPIDVDLRGDEAAIRERLMPVETATSPEKVEPTRPGRPKLGVVPREVTLLPRHWDWLASQPGGASVTLRKLVEAARRQHAGADDRRAAQESTYRFMAAMTGNEIGFEEAIRALFADDRTGFARLTEAWPSDLRQHILDLAVPAFTPDK